MAGHKTSGIGTKEKQWHFQLGKRSIRDLAVLLDQDKSVEAHVSFLCRSCFYQMCRIRSYREIYHSIPLQLLYTLLFWCAWTMATLYSQVCRKSGYDTFSSSSTVPPKLSLICYTSHMFWTICERCCTGFWSKTGLSSRSFSWKKIWLLLWRQIISQRSASLFLASLVDVSCIKWPVETCWSHDSIWLCTHIVLSQASHHPLEQSTFKHTYYFDTDNSRIIISSHLLKCTSLDMSDCHVYTFVRFLNGIFIVTMAVCHVYNVHYACHK